jgi:hypothetical protein
MNWRRVTERGAATAVRADFGAAEIRGADARVGLLGVMIERRRQ